jgi:competence CoiA-like predicted nuclease
MLTAKYIDTKEIIDITKFSNPRQEIDKKKLVCKLCDNPVSIRHGLVRAKHFYHLSTCTCDFERHPESAEHNLAKELIANHVIQYWSEYSKVQVVYEYPLSEIKRIADIAMLFPSGWLVIHEIQLSSITSEQLQKRTNDYNSIGADVIWWLGKGADSTANRSWCVEKYGYSLSLDYEILSGKAKSFEK